MTSASARMAASSPRTRLSGVSASSGLQADAGRRSRSVSCRPPAQPLAGGGIPTERARIIGIVVAGSGWSGCAQPGEGKTPAAPLSRRRSGEHRDTPPSDAIRVNDVFKMRAVIRARDIWRGLPAGYHLQVKTVKRSAGRSVTAAAAYRAGKAICCEREVRLHDYIRKGGEEAFLVAPGGTPPSGTERMRPRSGRTASLPGNGRSPCRRSSRPPSGGSWRELAGEFAQALVDRYGIAADVAIHAPHREGDDRNRYAHILTTTRRMGPEGLGAKTRVLDAVRGAWAEMQNRALKRVRGSGSGWRMRWSAARDYEPVTHRGRATHEARTLRALYAELRVQVEQAREVCGETRKQGHDRIEAGRRAQRPRQLQVWHCAT